LKSDQKKIKLEKEDSGRDEGKESGRRIRNWVAEKSRRDEDENERKSKEGEKI
jgi:hypothetical protein